MRWNFDRLLILLASIANVSLAQLPFFLQRFRPIRHSLLASGSSPYSASSSLFPLSASSSLLSPTYSSLLGGSNLGSSFTSGLSFSASSLSPQLLGSSSNLFAPSGLGTLSFSPSSYLGSSPSFTSGHLDSSPSFASGLFSSSPSFGSTQFSSSPSFASGQFSSSPSFASGQFASSPSFASRHPHLGSPGHPWASSSSLDTGGAFEGLGSFDPADLLDDYRGFSNAGFGKDLNFAGSEAVK